MKIAQVSPLYESVPPKLYGGTERVVAYLTDELVNNGHEVTLFASGDSHTKAELVSVTPKALRLENCSDAFAHHIVQLQLVLDMAEKFDIIHYHTDYFHFPLSRIAPYTHLTTLHGRLNLPELGDLYRHFPDVPLISISFNQRNPLPSVNWVGNVYHGLPLDLYRQGNGNGGYMAFIGRVSPEKRLDRAIEIAGIAGVPIKVAAKIDIADKPYYEGCIKKMLKLPHVEFLGEVGEHEKNDLLGNAFALLFPIDWPEPFGMVMIESLACGTPVIAFGHGSVPEIIDHGRTGFIVNSIEEAVAAVNQVDRINRNNCRRAFTERFSVTRMAHDYETVYQTIIDDRNKFTIQGNNGSDNIDVNALTA